MQKVLISVYWSIGYIVFGFILYFILKKVNKNLFDRKQKGMAKSSHIYKKLETIEMIIKNIFKYLIIIVIILMIMAKFGVNISSFVAGLGIVGAIAGLASQDLLKDIIGGISIIMENQFAVGDTIKVGNFEGEVISISLKSTRIKNYDGTVKILANRNVIDIINYNMAPSRAIVDVGVSYETDLDKVEKILMKLVSELSNSLENLKGPVELLGIQELSDSSVKFRITALCVSMEHYGVERKIRKAIKDRLDRENIKIPYPQIEVHHGE